MSDHTVHAIYPEFVVSDIKDRYARALMSGNGVRYFYRRGTGRNAPIADIVDAANQHCISTYGTLSGMYVDLVNRPRKLSKTRREAFERMHPMFCPGDDNG